LIDVASISENNGAVLEVHFRESVNDFQKSFKDFDFPKDFYLENEIAFDGKAMNSNNIMILSGVLKVSYLTQCARCLKDVRNKLNIFMEEIYTLDCSSLIKAKDGVESEEDFQAEDGYVYSANVIDP